MSLATQWRSKGRVVAQSFSREYYSMVKKGIFASIPIKSWIVSRCMHEDTTPLATKWCLGPVVIGSLSWHAFVHSLLSKAEADEWSGVRSVGRQASTTWARGSKMAEDMAVPVETMIYEWYDRAWIYCWSPCVYLYWSLSTWGLNQRMELQVMYAWQLLSRSAPMSWYWFPTERESEREIH